MGVPLVVASLNETAPGYVRPYSSAAVVATLLHVGSDEAIALGGLSDPGVAGDASLRRWIPVLASTDDAPSRALIAGAG